MQAGAKSIKEALIICGRFPADLAFKRRDRFVVSFNRGKG
jgi:hypothetical protein